MSYYSKVRPRNKRNKKGDEIKHSSMRSKQRFHIELTEELRSTIKKEIKRGRATFVRRQSLRVTHWKVKLNGCPEMVVVYDEKRKEIVTLLYPENKSNGETKGLSE